MKKALLTFVLGLIITVSSNAQSPKTPCGGNILGIDNPGSTCPAGSKVCVGTFRPASAEDPNCSGDGSVTPDPLCCVTVPTSGPICWTASNSSCGEIDIITSDECTRYMFSLQSPCGGPGQLEDNWTAWWDGTKWNTAIYPVGHQSQYTLGGVTFYDLVLYVNGSGNLAVGVNGATLVDNDGNTIGW
jgi:hypothetical protein